MISISIQYSLYRSEYLCMQVTQVQQLDKCQNIKIYLLFPSNKPLYAEKQREQIHLYVEVFQKKEK